MKLTHLYIFLLTCFASTTFVYAENKNAKLVVGIVVDQMRFDQLYKYSDKYSASGFRRLINTGFNFKNSQYDYTPTVTAAGHASIHTGTTPAVHGVIANSWYDREENRYVQSVQDESVKLVGSKQDNNIGSSPKNLLTTTFSDQLKMNSQLRSNVISISFKDRAAVLSGGHLADAAYWQDIYTSPGYFVSSSYYMQDVPSWVRKFNALEKADKYLNSLWNPLYPIDSYNESYDDDNLYEMILGDDKAVFPYDFNKLREKYRARNLEYLMLSFTPLGNTLTTDFAIEAIEQEKLGKGNDIDFLSVSYSITDKVGHLYGPDSVELADVFVRLDRELARLFSKLDEFVGSDNYVLFLTSDHGAIPVASYLNDIGIPTEVARIEQYKSALENYLDNKYGEHDWVVSFDNEQVYLNRDLIQNQKLSLSQIQLEASDILVEQQGIRAALTATQLRTRSYDDESFRKLVQSGYYPKRSGDVVLVFEAGVVLDDNSEIHVSEVKGTIHGSGYSYDNHVPLIFMGVGVKQGESVRKVSPIDIPATLTMILNLQLPSGNTGKPLFELFQ